MSLFQRLWTFIRRPTGYVGKDLQGNLFYEYPSQTSARTKRVVKFEGKDDMLAVANRNRLLAVQWKAWLTHTRSEPPTLQELQMDIARMERLRQNVAMIEARDREARLAVQSPVHHVSSSPFPPNASTSQQGPKDLESAQSRPRLSTPNVTGAAQARDLDSGVSRPHPASLASSSTLATSGFLPDVTSELNDTAKQRTQQAQRVPATKHDPWVSHPASDEPAAWVPRAVHRG